MLLPVGLIEASGLIVRRVSWDGVGEKTGLDVRLGRGVVVAGMVRLVMGAGIFAMSCRGTTRIVKTQVLQNTSHPSRAITGAKRIN